MTGDMDTRKYLPLETESFYEPNDNTEIFLPGKLSRMMEQKLANNTNRSQRICCRSRADPTKVARCFLISLSFKSRFLSWYYDSPEPNNEISRQLILMLGGLQLYSKQRLAKSNIFRRCWLRAIEFRSNCWQILLLLSTLTKVIKFPY